jgi:hypothetical protein
MARNRLIHRAIQKHNERLEIGPFTTRPQPDPGLVAFGGHLLEPIDTEIHPYPGKRALNDCRDARLDAAMSMPSYEACCAETRARSLASRSGLSSIM